MRKLFFIIGLILFLAACAGIELPDVVVVTATPVGNSTVMPTVEPTQAVPTNTPVPIPSEQPQFPEVNRLSYVINGVEAGDEAVLLAHLRDICPRVVGVMDDIILAARIYEVSHDCLPDGYEPIVFHRNFSALEGGECTRSSAEERVNRWIQEEDFLAGQGFDIRNKILRYSVNEPVYNETTMPDCLSTEIRLMARARNEGFTVVMSNWAVGTIQPHWIEQGMFDDYLRALSRYNHVMGAHEYTSAVLPFGVGMWRMECLADRECVQIENWSLDVPVERQDLVSQQVDDSFGAMMMQRHYERVGQFEAQGALGTNFNSYWHLRRADWFLNRADDIGVERPTIILTEAFHDHLDDINAVLDPLEAEYGLPQYMWDLRGANTYTDLWRWYYPQWSQAEALMCQYLWTELIYPEEYVGFTIFAWNRNPMWISFDLSGVLTWHSEFHRLLKRYADGDDLWNEICLNAA